MKQPETAARHQSEAEERRRREAALDKTIEASFPASDPPSTNPNPDMHEPSENPVPTDEESTSGH